MWGNVVRGGGWVSIQCKLIVPAKIPECEGMEGCISPCCRVGLYQILHEKCDSIA